MWVGRLLRACVVALAFSVAAGASRPAQAQANFDRPGGDYQNSTVASGDPAGGCQSYSQRTSGGSDMRMDSVRPRD